jgi:hypothetical protein
MDVAASVLSVVQSAPPPGGRLGPGEMGSCGEEVITLIWTILGLLCIVLGFVGELIDERILIGTLEWFVAAIAFNTLGGLPGVFTKRRG